MPPKIKISRQDVIGAALALVREEGIGALNARSLATRLSCSTQPIFSNFASMDDLQAEVISAANLLYESFLSADMQKGEYPPYKASGMAYIRFAKEEKELFKLLFMRDRANEQIIDGKEELRPIISLIMQNLGISEDDAFALHLEMWIFVHGIASMVATNYLNWDISFISQALSDAYQGLKHKYEKELDKCTQ